MITILQQSAEEMNTIDQTIDLVYMDPPFGLQRDFTMLEEDGKEKSFSDHWDSFDDYITEIENTYKENKLSYTYEKFSDSKSINSLIPFLISRS